MTDRKPLHSPIWRWRFPSPQRRSTRNHRRRSLTASLGNERREVEHDVGVSPPATMNHYHEYHHSSLGLTSATHFLLGPGSLSTGSPPLNSPPSRRNTRNRRLSETTKTPFLTLALLKLEQILPQFCQNLAQANLESTTRACAALDTFMSNNYNNPTNTYFNNSPSSATTASSNNNDNSPRSPRSPGGFLQWLPDLSPNRQGNYNSSRYHMARSMASPTSSSRSALALESEWDKLQHGFLLLATAEYLYHDIQQSKRGHALRGLYEYILLQLAQVHTVLCEPFLAISSLPSRDSNKYVAAAQQVAQTLQCLVTLCQVRMQLIDIQSNLFTVISDLDTVKKSIATLLAVTEGSLVVVPPQQDITESGPGKPQPLPASGAAAPVATPVSSSFPVPQTPSGLPQLVVSTAAKPVTEALLQELKGWKYLLEASVGLERCEFMSTLLSIRRCQINLKLPAQTRLAKWFQESCQVFISLLPIYFDRVSAFAKPLYGYDPTLTPAASSPFFNWEAKVHEFLSKQEKAGGPPTTVAVVLDAVGAGNLHVERGFQIRSSEEHKDDTDLPESVMWPAVYMRSTMHLEPLSSHLPRGYHSQGKSGGSSGYLHKRGSDNATPEWSFVSQTNGLDHSSSRLFASSSRNLENDSHAAVTTTTTLLPKNRIFEYGPDVGVATSWPHNEWTTLVSLLAICPDDKTSTTRETTSETVLPEPADMVEPIRMVEEPVAITYRQDADETHKKQKHVNENSKWKPSLERAVRIFGVYANSDMNAVDSHSVRHDGKRRSTVHVVSLSKYLSMVVMVKEEESHFLRRRSPLSDDEIRDFMNRMAAHWQVSRRFSHDSLPKPLSNNGRIELIHDEWDAPKIEVLIQKIKSTFGLRPTSYPLTEGHRGISFLQRNSPQKVSRRVSEGPTVDASVSAATFFLGAELAKLLDV